MSTARRPLEERFRAKVEIRAADECWPWRGWIDDKGYGLISVGGRGAQKRLKAHRVAYELLVAPIPAGLTLDHLCRNRACANPAHLEPVTSRENTLRGESVSARYARRDRCVRGHEFTSENTRITPAGARDCRTCGRERARETRSRRLAREGATA